MELAFTDLKGKRILVTGGNGHIGRVLVEHLRGLGAQVLATDHNIEQGYKCDLTNHDDVRSMARRIIEGFWWLGGLDCLVHCAALTGQGGGLRSGWIAPLESQSVEAFNYSLQVQVLSCFILLQELAKPLMDSSGSVVIYGSIYGNLAPKKKLYENTGYTSPFGYSATKGAVLALMRHFATELAPKCRVNMITPGGLLRGQDPDFITGYEAEVPLERMGTEEDLVGPTVFLLSDMSRYITGHQLMVDGGWSVW